MKKTACAITIVSGLIVSLLLGVQFIQLVQANGYILQQTYNGPPTITIESPLNNEIFSFNTVVFAFTLIKPSFNWTSRNGVGNRVAYVDIIVDEIFYGRVDVDSELMFPFSYSLNLTDLQHGIHSAQLVANCRGVSKTVMYPSMEWEGVSYYTTWSDIVSFTVDSPESTPTPEPTSTTPPPTPISGEGMQEKQLMDTLIAIIAGAASIAGVVLLYYITKRK